ncbi:hypothetical protein Pla22_26680 [Rubripirellula amarantea]|uniref:Uncharacterized protein n=1 Tax=Rubripirellula amarantea TaxID=2527999 RepID=A0A5C5WVN2_9BACT|nr:hypothetical protein Pla22_26680 [Rubripirellula amarantea]
MLIARIAPFMQDTQFADNPDFHTDVRTKKALPACADKALN